MAERKTASAAEQKVTLTLEELQALVREEVAKAKGAEPEKAEMVVLPEPEPEMVKIKLFKDGGKYSEPVFVAVNGRRWIVPRGVEVEIPDYVAEVLERSMEQDQATALMIEKLENRFNEKTKTLG